MSNNVISLQNAKDMGLEIPRTYKLRSLSTQTLNTVSDIGWYVCAKGSNNEFYFCYTAQARHKDRIAIDNEILEVKNQSGQPVKELLVDGSVIQWLVEKYENTEESDSELSPTKAQERFIDWAWTAHDMGASDVHLMESSDISTVVFRIHGLPYDYLPIARKTASRIVEAGMQLSPNRQGTPDRHKIEDLRIELSRGGEKITLRLNKTGSEPGTYTVYRITQLSEAKTFKQLRLPAHTYNALDSMSKKPDGVIIITAPTNHGKSETLSAIYNSLDSERIVQLVSDPIERTFPDKGNRLVQKEVNESDENRTYEALFLAALRQDPNVVGIAEMRDKKAANAVYQASLGGRLMITTYHATDPFSALTRLINDGLSPLVLADQSRCFASQRLLPELCPHCRIETNKKGVYIRNKNGCEHCVLGAIGRRVTAEALTIGKEHRDFIMSSDIKGLEAFAKENGYITMQNDVRGLVENGEVCPVDAEVIVGNVFSNAEQEELTTEVSAA